MKSPFQWLVPFTTAVFFVAQILLFNHQLDRRNELENSFNTVLNQVQSSNQNTINNLTRAILQRDTLYAKNFNAISLELKDLKDATK